MNARQFDLPSALGAEWELIIRVRHNLLLVGSSSATREMLVAMRPYLQGPVHQHEPRNGTPVPQPTEGTLILLEVEGLNSEQQTQLLRWLDEFDQRPRVQIVSTTSAPLFSLVENGAFLPDLYYRLNLVRIELTDPGEGSL